MSRPLMSEELNHVLDGYGLSRNFTEYRRLVMNYFSVQITYTWDHVLVGNLVVGSKRDALCSCTNNESDLDVLGIFPAMVCDAGGITTAKHLLSTKPNLEETIFLLKNGRFPGYKYLKYIGNVKSEVLLTTPFRGCQYLLNYTSLFPIRTDNNSQCEVHGPAFHHCDIVKLSNNDTLYTNIDYVPGFYCRFLPADYDEWCNRNRNHNWPPPWIIEATKKQGCLVVGVGHPASDTQNIEWRLSLAKTELLLTKSFNHVQIKCYAMMKLVLKWIIQPQMKEPLSSYHVKTVMFWMSEEREKQFWRPENHPECFISSFQKLKTFVENKNCPNYFLTDVNLLDRKLEGDIHHQAIDILDNIITEGPKVVYECLPLNPLLNECKHSIDVSCACFLLKERLKELALASSRQIYKDAKAAVDSYQIYHRCRFALVDWYLVNEIRNQSELFSHAFSTLSIVREIGLRNQCLNSLQNKMTDRLREHGHVARIKLATYFYYKRFLVYCIPLLRLVIESMESTREFEVCTHEQACASDMVEIEGVECIYLTQNKKGFRVSEIVFSPCDKRLIPPDLQDEMGRPKTVNGIHYEGWVFVDSIVYAYYLLIVTLHDMRSYKDIISLFKRFENVYTQTPGTIRIFRKDMAKRLYEHAYILVWAATKGFTKLSS